MEKIIGELICKKKKIKFGIYYMQYLPKICHIQEEERYSKKQENFSLKELLKKWEKTLILKLERFLIQT